MQAPEGVGITSAAAQSADVPAVAGEWTGSFPHDRIEQLFDRLQAGVNAGDAAALLIEIVAEAKRLRASVLRLTTEKVAEAEQEADAVRQAAVDEVAHLRDQANSTVLARLAEAERAAASIVAAARLEASKIGHETAAVLGTARTEVDRLGEQIRALLGAADGVLPHLTQVGASMTEIAARLAGDDDHLDTNTDTAVSGLTAPVVQLTSAARENGRG